MCVFVCVFVCVCVFVYFFDVLVFVGVWLCFGVCVCVASFVYVLCLCPSFLFPCIWIYLCVVYPFMCVCVCMCVSMCVSMRVFEFMCMEGCAVHVCLSVCPVCMCVF